MIEIIKANKRLAITTLVLWLLSRLELLWLKTAQAPPLRQMANRPLHPSLVSHRNIGWVRTSMSDTEGKTPEELAGETYGKL